MRRTYSAVLLVIIVALVLAACGSSGEPIVKKPAKDIIIRVDDLGEGWTMVKEWDGLEALNLKASSYLDANSRRFGGDARMALALVATTKTVKKARREMEKGDVMDSNISNTRNIFPDMTFERVQTSALADEQTMVRGEFGRARMYSIVLRKDNVLAALTLIGDESVASQKAIERLARLMVSRTQ